MIRGMCGMAVNKDEYWRRQGTCGRRGGKNVWVSETKVPNGVYRGGNVEAKTSQTKVQCKFTLVKICSITCYRLFEKPKLNDNMRNPLSEDFMQFTLGLPQPVENSTLSTHQQISWSTLGRLGVQVALVVTLMCRGESWANSTKRSVTRIKQSEMTELTLHRSRILLPDWQRVA